MHAVNPNHGRFVIEKKERSSEVHKIDTKSSTFHCPEEEPSLENPHTLARNYSNTICLVLVVSNYHQLSP